jgi:hypothetical protein
MINNIIFTDLYLYAVAYLPSNHKFAISMAIRLYNDYLYIVCRQNPLKF